MKITDNLILQKVSEFIKLSINREDELESELHTFRKEAAADEMKQIKFEASLKKAAQALYDADFITDEYERKTFLKRAKEDPSYLARMIEKICDAADVASIGSPARVTKPKTASSDYDFENDPVARRAFGFHKSSIIDE